LRRLKLIRRNISRSRRRKSRRRGSRDWRRSSLPSRRRPATTTTQKVGRDTKICNRNNPGYPNRPRLQTMMCWKVDSKLIIKGKERIGRKSPRDIPPGIQSMNFWDLF